MSQRVEQRVPTAYELDAYSKCLLLTEFTFGVCKARDKGGENHKHIPKRFGSLARQMESLVTAMGANILEANEIYIRENLEKSDRIRNYIRRLELQRHAISLSYQLEHYMRVLHAAINFAESTISHWMELMWETRRLLIAWRDKDARNLRSLQS